MEAGSTAFSRSAHRTRRNSRSFSWAGVSIRKGIPYLLQAFAQLSHPKKRLKIIGDVAPEAEPLLRKLPMDHVEIIGAVPNHALAMHYSTADVMVLPSLEDGFGMVMAEAMACGCPVIASENTGGPDLFTDGIEGRIIPIRSHSRLLEALEAFAQDQDSARRMGEKARERIKSLGGYDRYGAQWESLLQEMEPGQVRRAPTYSTSGS